MLDGEQLAGASESRLHLIGDVQNFVAVEHFLDVLEVVGWRNQDAALAHHWLGDEGRDIAGRLVLHRPLDHLSAARGYLVWIIGAKRIAIHIRCWRKGDARW